MKNIHVTQTCEHFNPTIGCIKDICSCNKEPKKEPFKHKVEVLSREEIIANRSNAYQFIDFDKQETLEEKLDKIVSKEPSKFLEESEKRMEAKAKLFRYSEEEVIELNLRYLQELGKAQSENGHWMSFKEWFDKVKKK